MRKSEKACDVSQNVGIYVELALSGNEQFRYKLSVISPYRVKLLISLPPGSKENWASGIRQIIKKVETGAQWPLRFEYENVIQFISLEDLEYKIEKGLPGVTAYVYGVPVAAEKSSFDDETLRRWFNAAARAAYPSQARASSAPLEGQLMLDLG